LSNDTTQESREKDEGGRGDQRHRHHPYGHAVGGGGRAGLRLWQCIEVVRPGNIASLFVIGDGGGGRAMPMPAWAWAWALSMLVGLAMVDSLIDIIRQTADPPH